MSTIAGIYFFDEQTVDTGLLQRMMDAGVETNPEIGGAWTGDHIGLAYGGFMTFGASSGDTQPLSTNDGTSWIVFDGRIDSAPEIMDESVLSSADSSSTDPRLVLEAYKKWGTNCASHLFGDFAFAIWDQRKQVLYLARDALGTRPLFYFLDDRRLLFA